MACDVASLMVPDVSKDSTAFILNNQVDREKETRRNKKLFLVHFTLENECRSSFAASGPSHLTTKRHVSEHQNRQVQSVSARHKVTQREWRYGSTHS